MVNCNHPVVNFNHPPEVQGLSMGNVNCCGPGEPPPGPVTGRPCSAARLACCGPMMTPVLCPCDWWRRVSAQKTTRGRRAWWKGGWYQWTRSRTHSGSPPPTIYSAPPVPVPPHHSLCIPDSDGHAASTGQFMTHRYPWSIFPWRCVRLPVLMVMCA